MKIARTVLSGGKGGDYLKTLPIAIISCVNTSGASIGRIGTYGTNDAIVFYFVGESHLNPLMKVEPDGTVTAKNFKSTNGGLLASGNGNASTGYTAAVSELSKRNSLLAEVTVKDSSNNQFYVSLTIPAAYIVSGETFIVSRIVTNGAKSYNQSFYVTATGSSINIQQKVPQTTVVSEAKIYGLS